jgi:hypothetical protein
VLQEVDSEDIWIWHCFSGLPGSLNDTNMLHISHLFSRLASGDVPACNYTVNGHDYTMGVLSSQQDQYFMVNIYDDNYISQEQEASSLFQNARSSSERQRELLVCCKLGLQLFEV